MSVLGSVALLLTTVCVGRVLEEMKLKAPLSIKDRLGEGWRFCLLVAGILLVQVAPQVQANPGAQAQQPQLRDVQIGSQAFERGTPLPGWVDTIHALPDAEKKDAHVVRFADVHFYVDKQPVSFVHRAMQANEKSALGEIGQYPISLHPDYQRLELHLLRIHRGDLVIDKLGSAQIRFVQRELGLDYGIYTGVVTAIVITDDLRVGDTLEIAYSTIGQNPIFGGKFFDNAAWDGPYPVKHRRVTLNVPRNRHINYRVVGSAAKQSPAPSERYDGARKIIRFEGSDLPAADLENHLPNDYQAVRWIQFSEFGNWNEVNQWAQRLFNADAQGTALHNFLSEARGASTQSEKVRKVLALVQNDIRYLSISLGENSHRPFPPDQVLARRYGDCKDKSLLMISLLRQLGIEAVPVLMSTYFRKNLDQMLPSPYPFDHVIVRAHVDGKDFFLDPTLTGQVGKLDRIGWPYGEAEVLVVATDTHALTRVTGHRSEEAMLNTRIERISVQKFDQPVDMTVDIRYVGTDAEAVRRAVASMTSAQIRKAYESVHTRRYPGAELVGEPKITDEPNENVIDIELRYRISNFFESVKEGRMARYLPVNLTEQFFLPNGPKRSVPILIPGFPSVNRYIFEMTLPEEVDASYRPSRTEISNKAFYASEALTFSGRVARAELELKILADRVEPEVMADFVRDTRKLDMIMHGTFIVHPEDMKRANASRIPAKPFKLAVVERLEHVLKTTDEGLAEARLLGSDRTAIYCERARALAYLGNAKEALESAQAALRLNTNAADAYRCRGTVFFVNGELHKSEADFSRALALGHKDSDLFFKRGLANYFLQRYDAALADFAASQEMAESVEQVRAEYWRVLAASRVSPELHHRVDVTGGEEWPGPVLNLLGAAPSPENVLRAAHRESGEALEAALAEAYLYVAQYHLRTGNRLKASVYFQQAVDKGVLYSMLHAAARHELGRITGGE